MVSIYFIRFSVYVSHLPSPFYSLIGIGWGSLAILAVQMTGCTVDTLTLSSEQQSLAQERIRAAGLTESITVHLMDYRSIPQEWNGTFDRFVSIEMIEAVGGEFMEVYWGVVNRALKPTNAVGVVQSTTIPEASECFVSLLVFLNSWLILVLVKRTRKIHARDRLY